MRTLFSRTAIASQLALDTAQMLLEIRVMDSLTDLVKNGYVYPSCGVT